MDTKVSIIVPCFNQAQFLDEALQSVLAQSYQNWECVIVNDGSNDNTENIALEWCQKDKRFKYLFQQNKGVSKARNTGIEQALGEYIQFLDSDDILSAKKIEYQIKILENNMDIDIIYGSSRYFFDHDKNSLFPIHPKGIIPTVDLCKNDQNQKEMLVRRNICTICSSLYKRKIFENLRFKKIIFEDWLFHYECSLNDFKFHFDNSTDSFSFIRITQQSQMESHIKRNEDVHHFREELDSLGIEYNFYSIFSKKDKSVKKTGNRWIKKFSPPIVYEWLKK